MKSWITRKGNRVFQVLSGRSNSYLIKSGGDVIVVDTGKESSYQKFNRNVRSLLANNREIAYLVLTHTHFDHCQSAKKIKDAYGCKVIVSAEASGSIQNGYSRLPKGAFLITNLISKIGQAIGKNKFGYQPFEADILLESDIGLNSGPSAIKLIQTPGHSKDCISILVDDEIAIVGDAMFGIFSNSVFPPYSDNIEKMLLSWDKLLGTGCNMYLPGHGKEIKKELLEREYIKYKRKYLTDNE